MGAGPPGAAMQVTTAQALALFVVASFLTRTKYHALYVSWHEHHEELHGGQRFVTLVEHPEPEPEPGGPGGAAAAEGEGDAGAAACQYADEALCEMLLAGAAAASAEEIKALEAGGKLWRGRAEAAQTKIEEAGLAEWLRPEGPFARPDHGQLVMNRQGMERRGALYVPKWDSPKERVWPHPSIKLRGDPFSLQHKTAWDAAKGRTWRHLLDLIPAADEFKGRKYRSCAVVGNGGSVLLYQNGEAISRHEAVIRFNRGPMEGYERHVGNRTTFRIVNRNNIGWFRASDEAVLQHITAPEAVEDFVKFKRKNKRSPVFGIDPDFHGLVLQKYQNLLKGLNELHSAGVTTGVGGGLNADTPATNGFYGISLAMDMCHRISLYGFAREWNKNLKYNKETKAAKLTHVRAKYHYFDGEEPNAGQQKRDDDEFRGLAALIHAQRKRIRFGEPCASGCHGGRAGPRGAAPACPYCEVGSTCSCRAWHPVPRPGHCYRPDQSLTCFPKCADPASCPGGVDGLCPPGVPASGCD